MDKLIYKYNGKFRNQDRFKVLDRVIQFAIDNHIYYHDSIDSCYENKSPSSIRKMSFYLNYTFITIQIIKYGTLTIHPATWLQVMLGESLILIGDQVYLVDAVLFIDMVIVFVAKLTISYYEARSEMEIFNLISNWKKQLPSYKLSMERESNLMLKANILYWVYIKFIGGFIFGACTIILIVFCLVIYFNHNYDYNLIVLGVNFLMSLHLMNQVRAVILSGTFFFYVPIAFLNHHLDELIKSIRANIRWRNYNGIFINVWKYNEITKMISRLSGPYNVIIGLNYCIVPYMMAVSIKVIRTDQQGLLQQLPRLIPVLFVVAANVNAYIINQISASITVRNKSIAKYLYPMFCGQRVTKLLVKLKIESLIDRLNNQFVGFYTFNLFKFTKTTFYEYILVISWCYMMISNFIADLE